MKMTNKEIEAEMEKEILEGQYLRNSRVRRAVNPKRENQRIKKR
jgi:hypothetical protein